MENKDKMPEFCMYLKYFFSDYSSLKKETGILFPFQVYGYKL